LVFNREIDLGIFFYAVDEDGKQTKGISWLSRMKLTAERSKFFIFYCVDPNRDGFDAGLFFLHAADLRSRPCSAMPV
jgi:hypothetical protein